MSACSAQSQQRVRHCCSNLGRLPRAPSLNLSCPLLPQQALGQSFAPGRYSTSQGHCFSTVLQTLQLSRQGPLLVNQGCRFSGGSKPGDLLEVVKVTFIQFADVMAGTGRLATLYVAFDGTKLPAAFCKLAVNSRAGKVPLIRQSIAQLHTKPNRSEGCCGAARECPAAVYSL